MKLMSLRWGGSACLVTMLAWQTASQASAQQNQNWKWCEGRESDGTSVDLQIRGCTAIIQAGRDTRKNLAIAYNNRASAYYDKREYDRAITDATEAIRLDPSYGWPYVTRADALADTGEYDRAIADLNTVIRTLPKDACIPCAYNSRANAWKSKGELGRAIADYGEAIRREKKALFYRNRGDARRDNGDLARALPDYNEAIRLDPKYASAYDKRGDAYRAKNEHDRAIADYSEAIRLDPNYATAYDDRGDAYRAKGDHDRAIADYSDAIRLDPDNAVYRNDRGAAYSAKGELNRAIADYSEAIRLDPKYASAYENRGRANLYLGSLPEAMADLNQASERGPKGAYAALWLHIVNKRSNLPSRLPQATARLDMTKWPAPVVRLYLGEMTPEAVLAAADDADAQTGREQVCEANFYSGELVLMQGANEKAARLFRLAAADCPKNFTEWSAANAELRALGVTP
jgi:tetratricopeptide (TPR) repeat protein